MLAIGVGKDLRLQHLQASRRIITEHVLSFTIAQPELDTAFQLCQDITIQAPANQPKVNLVFK